MRCDTRGLVTELRRLMTEIPCEDGITRVTLSEAANRLEELSVAAKRYETVRRFTPLDFKKTCLKSLSGVPFDKLIDEVIEDATS